MSGLTTTGATVLEDVETLPMGILFWRSFTHWLGGMGILVFALAILPTLGVGGFQIFKAESPPGPVPDKLTPPRIATTSKVLYTVYLAITLLQISVFFMPRDFHPLKAASLPSAQWVQAGCPFIMTAWPGTVLTGF